MHNYRYLSILRNRIRNRLTKYVNIVRFHLYGIETGDNFVVHGMPYIRLFKSAKVRIGSNFYMSNGLNINALSSNRRGSIYATDNAEIIIGNNVGMSSCVLWCHEKISIGDNVKIGANCVLIDTDSHSLDPVKRRSPLTDGGISSPITIGNDVFIGMNCIVLKGVTIGDRTIVGAGSVVTNSIPNDCVVAGNPAKIIKQTR